MGVNVRRVRTQRQIYRAAGKLLTTMPYDKLRTSQIAEEALISRSGFYLYFSDKDAMVTAYLEFLMDEIREIRSKHYGSIDELNKALFQIVELLHDEELFAALISDKSSLEVISIIHTWMRSIVINYLVSYCQVVGVEFESLDNQMEYYVDVMVESFIAIFTRWFQRRKFETVEEVTNILHDVLLSFMSIAPLKIGNKTSSVV